MTDIQDRVAPQACATQTTSSPAPARSLPVARQRMDQWRREEPALIRAWQEENSDEALSTLLKRYQSLFRSQISKILSGRSVSTSHRHDLEQEAHLAFVQAVSRYDFNAGTPLSAFAIKYIRNALMRYTLDFRHAYRIGTGSEERKAYYRALSRRAHKIHTGESEFLTEEDITSIQKETGASEKSTRRAVDSIYANTCAVEAALDVATEHTEQSRSENGMAIERAMELLEPFIATLCPRKTAILAQFLSDGEINGPALAREFNVSAERIGQIRREMLGEMAEFLRERGIDANSLF